MQKLMDFIIGFSLGALGFYIKETLDLPAFTGIVLAILFVAVYLFIDTLISRRIERIINK